MLPLPRSQSGLHRFVVNRSLTEETAIVIIAHSGSQIADLGLVAVRAGYPKRPRESVTLGTPCYDETVRVWSRSWNCAHYLLPIAIFYPLLSPPDRR